MEGAPTTCDPGVVDTKAVSLQVFIDKNDNSNKDSDEEATTINFYASNPTSASAIYSATDATPVGVGSFIPYPGDEKVTLEYLHGSSLFPTLSHGIKSNRLKVYFSTNSLAEATYAQATGTAILNFDADGALDDGEISGLENGTLYVFRVAPMDLAGNIVANYPSAEGGASTVDTSCYTFSAATPSDCIVAATPDQVLGLLSKDVNCFVATAAYGSSLEPKLKVFREFRHKILLRSEWGRKFVSSYYHYGPIAARFISDKPALRFLTRGVLWPAYGMTWITLNWGAGFALSIGIFAALLTVAGIFFFSRRVFRRA
jgi:hypothetical protein